MYGRLWKRCLEPLLVVAAIYFWGATAQQTIWQQLADNPQFALGNTGIPARYPELVAILNSTEVLYTMFATPLIAETDVARLSNPELVQVWAPFLFKGTPPFNASVRQEDMHLLHTFIKHLHR